LRDGSSDRALDTRKIVGQRKQLLPPLRGNQPALLLYQPIVLFLRLSQRAEIVIPIRFNAVGDKPIIGIDFHMPAASGFSLVLCAFRVPSL
jgi:hypothetical protein